MPSLFTPLTIAKVFILFSLIWLTSACKPDAELATMHLATGSAMGTTLTWSANSTGTSTLTTVSIDQGIGEVAFSGSLNITPTETTTYTLTATSYSGAGTPYDTIKTVTVYVDLPLADIPFTDNTLRACVGRYGDTYAHEVDFIACGGLIDDYNGITNMEGVQYLSYINSVNFFFSTVHDLSPISKITPLVSVNFFDSDIGDLKPLMSLPNLHRLHLDKANVKSITPLLDVAHHLNDVQLTMNFIPCVQLFALGPRLEEGATYVFNQITGNIFTTCVG